MTRAVPPVTADTLPARPPAAITGSLTSMPEPLPWLMTTLEYQTVGERSITRAVTSFPPAAKLALFVSPVRARSSLASCTAVWFCASCWRSCATSVFSCLFCFLAWKKSPVELARLRTGRKAMLTPFSSGEKAACAPFEKLCSEPPADSPK